MEMNESTARLILTVTGTTATVCYIIAMYLALQGDQAVGMAFFAVAVTDSMAAAYFFRRYNSLRGNRWQSELKDSEEQMAALLSESREKLEGQENAESVKRNG